MWELKVPTNLAFLPSLENIRMSKNAETYKKMYQPFVLSKKYK